MQYKPLRKSIRFSEDVQNNPHFPQAMMVLKACGDNSFKDWLLYYADTFVKDNSYFDLMQKIKGHLSYLVSREVNLGLDAINECKSYFLPTLNEGVVMLLEQALDFFCKLQDMERAIQKMSDELATNPKGGYKDTVSGYPSERIMPRNALNKGIRYK